MKNIIKLLILVLVTSLSSNILTANSPKLFKTENGFIKVISNHKTGSIEYNDSLILVAEKHSKTIFLSEGRRIVDILYQDVNGDKRKDFLIQLDPGGNGGYSEFALLINTSKKFKKIWDGEAFKVAKATIKKGAKPQIVISNLKELKNDNFIRGNTIYKVVGNKVEMCQ